MHGNMNIKNTEDYLILYYNRSKLPRCVYFGHCCGHPQGGVQQTCKCKILSFKTYGVKYILKLVQVVLLT
jgi:hypothetical protein